EEAKHHAQEVNDMSYVNAEKTVGEIIRQRGPDWVTQGTEQIRQAAAISTPMRSAVALRSRLAEFGGGFDLRKQDRGRLPSITSACLAFSADGRRLAVSQHHR